MKTLKYIIAAVLLALASTAAVRAESDHHCSLFDVDTTASCEGHDHVSIFSSHQHGPLWKLDPLMLGGVGLGFTHTMGDTGDFDPEMSKSLEVNWLHAAGYRFDLGKVDLSLSMGFAWRNYRMTEGPRLTLHDGVLDTEAYPSDVVPAFSRLKIFYMQFPLLAQFEFTSELWSERIRMSVGPVLSVSPHASLLTQWRDMSGRKHRDSQDVSIQRRVTVDFIATISPFSFTGFYVRYSPLSVLKAGQPDFTSLSAGLIWLL